MSAQPLDRVRIGRTSIHVTRLGFGGSGIGGLYEEVPEEDAIAIVRDVLASGVNHLDTAPLYGFGKSETRLGLALQGISRDSFVISTKVGRLLVPLAPDEPVVSQFGNVPRLKPVFDFRYDAVMRSFESSLRRLQLDRIDICYIHDPEGMYKDAMAGAYPALQALREQGVIGAIGVGCWDPALLARFAHEGAFDVFLLAGNYTLLDQNALDLLLPLCAEKQISVVLGAPYASGILASGARNGAMHNYTAADAPTLDRVRRLDAICARHGVPLQAAALRFPLGHPAVASVIPGARSAAEAAQAFRMFAHPIPEALWQDFRSEGLIRPDAPVLA